MSGRLTIVAIPRWRMRSTIEVIAMRPDDDEEHERRAVLHALGVFVLRDLRADHVDVVRQRHDALEKEVGPVRDLPRQLVAHRRRPR